MESITHFGIPLFLLPFAHVMCFFPMLNTFPLFYVLETGKKAFVMSSHFMKKLMDNGYDGVRRWYRKVAYRKTPITNNLSPQIGVYNSKFLIRENFNKLENGASKC